MSGGYDLSGCKLFLRDRKVALSEEEQQRLMCVSCKKLLHKAFQCHCGHSVCESCKPST